MIEWTNDVKGTGIREIGHVKLLQTAADTELHCHPCHYEAILCLKGRSLFRYGKKTMDVMPGAMVVSKPGKQHCLQLNTRMLETYYVEFSVGSELGLTAAEQRRIRKALNERCGQPLNVGTYQREVFGRLVSVACEDQKKEKRPFKEIELRSAALAFVLSIVSLSVRSVGRRPDVKVSAWIESVRQHPESSPSLREVARECGCTVVSFVAAVKSATGYPPHAYVLKCRVEKSKELLAEGKRSIHAVADQLGFCGSQHYAFVFRKFVGKSPTEWRRERARQDGNKI